jgi:hypothetical protein
VGYTTLYQTLEIRDESRPFQIRAIELSRRTEELDAVEIIEALMPVSFRGDTIIYSADAFRAMEGAMLIDLLKRLPGVEVDRDGRITAHGRPVMQILIDGEVFFTDNPQIAAHNIPADFVETLHIYERISDAAQFTGIDDGREEMVIDLQLREDVRLDWFGRLRVGGGLDASNNFKYANSLNINSIREGQQLFILGNLNNSNRHAGDNNWIQDGAGGMFETGGGDMVGMARRFSPMISYVKRIDTTWQFTVSYRYRQDDERFVEGIFRENILPTGSQFHHSEGTRHNLEQLHNFNAEIRYTPNPNNEFIIQPRLALSSRTLETRTTFEMFEMNDDTATIINHGQTRNSFEIPITTAQLRLSYGHRFAKPQRSLRFELTGALRRNDFLAYNYTLQHFPDRPNDTLDQHTADRGNVREWQTTATYTEPLVRDFVLSLNYSVSNTQRENEHLQHNFNPITGTHDLLDTLFSSNHEGFVLRQNFLVQMQRTRENHNYSFGLGVVHSNTTNRMDGLPDISQGIFSIAPQAMFRYSFSRRMRLELRYNGRSRSPSVLDLRRVPDNFDPLNIQIGNPELNPEFTHSINARFTNFSERMHTLNAQFWFSVTQNRIANITISDLDLFPNIPVDSSVFLPGARIIMPDNVGAAHRKTAFISYGMPLFSERLHINASVRGGMGRSRNAINKDVNVINTWSLVQDLQITYRGERFDVGLMGYFDWNNTRHSLLPGRNSRFLENFIIPSASWTIIRDRLTLSSDLMYARTTGLYADHNISSTRWNAQLSYTIGRNNNGQILFQVVDILNDRRDNYRRVTDAYIEDMIFRNNMQRFFLVSFIWNKRQG